MIHLEICIVDYYFEIVAKLKGEIERRFDSPTFSLYSKVETVLF